MKLTSLILILFGIFGKSGLLGRINKGVEKDKTWLAPPPAHVAGGIAETRPEGGYISPDNRGCFDRGTGCGPGGKAALAV